MKKIYLTMLAALSFVTTLFGQVRYADLTGSHTGKMKYAAGKNAYLMDEYKLDYTYKIVMGDPVCVSNVSWTRNNSFTVNKKTVNYAKLANYEDLKMRFDRLVPDSAVFTYTMLFYSEQSKCFIASAKTSVTVPYIERAGITEGLEIPQTLSWLNSLSK